MFCFALTLPHFVTLSRSLGYSANKPIKHKKMCISKKEDNTADEPLSPSKNEQDLEYNHGHQENVHRAYSEAGILDEIDYEPMDGDSSGGAGSLSYSDEQPEMLRASSSVDGGSVNAPSKRSSKMSIDSFDIPDNYSLDGGESVARSSMASSRRSKLSFMGDDPLDMGEEGHIGLYTDASLREEPESHPSLLRNHSQIPLSQVIYFFMYVDLDAPRLSRPPCPLCVAV